MDTELPDQHTDRPSKELARARAESTPMAGAAESDQSERAGTKRIRPVFLVLQGLIAIAIVFGAGLIMQQMLTEKVAPMQRPVREQVFTVETIPLQRGDFQPEISVFGTIIAGNIIELRSELSGPLISVNPLLRSGSVLSAGTEIASIDPFDYETALAEADIDILDSEAKMLEAQARLAAVKADVSNAEAQLELAERDLERAQALVAKGSATRQTVDQRQQALLQIRASLDSARSNLNVEEAKLAQQKAAMDRLALNRKRAERNLNQTVLTAPADAVVDTESITLGQMVTANQVVAELLDLSAFEVRFTLSDEQYGRLTRQTGDQNGQLPGTRINVRWTVGARQETVPATISRTASTIAADRGGITLFAALDPLPAATDLRPGAFVEVSLPDQVYADAIRVPEAVLYDEQRIYVAEDGRLRSVPVSVLTFSGTNVLLQVDPADLADGARILTTRIAEVGDGLRVREAGSAAPEAERGGRSEGGGPGEGRGRGEGGRPAGGHGGG
tara:strand:- start:3032 stop:4543 length:1512 start_codon:yes stop_codon:yes gene_type:complete